MFPLRYQLLTKLWPKSIFYPPLAPPFPISTSLQNEIISFLVISFILQSVQAELKKIIRFFFFGLAGVRWGGVRGWNDLASLYFANDMHTSTENQLKGCWDLKLLVTIIFEKVIDANRKCVIYIEFFDLFFS